ncbi:DNA cytosine methyltransferase [Alkalihalobacillus sp. R86527]|uniref:DNA cytosine methyltransferase n=1 Tax=Alkalihalobacillus sp. R86527 TaxID=3093863 RepID=UPI00367228FC
MGKIKVIDLFSGAGGLSNGFEQTGRFEVVGAVEIDKWAAETYKQNHSNQENQDIIIKDANGKSDITNIDFELKFKHLDKNNLVVIGGPPCQGFSNANRQKNYLISGNNLLVLEFVRAIRQIQPIAFLMENVKNVISNKHKFYVTNYIENKRYKYTSREYIESISSGKTNLFNPEELIVVESENVSLKNEFENICAMFNDNDLIPIINGKRELSMLRKLHKLGGKNKLINFEKNNEKNEIKLIVDSIMYYKKSINIINDASILDKAQMILNELSEGQKVEGEELLKVLNPLIELNKLLSGLMGIQNEEIELQKEIKPTLDEANSIIMVKANVLSYNLVDYLINEFKKMGYITNKGTKDKAIINAADFGVPQNRNRFMLLGIKEGLLKEHLTEIDLPEKSIINKPFTVEDAIKDLEKINPSPEASSIKNTDYHYDESSSSPLQSYYRKQMEEEDKYTIYNHVNTKSKELSKKRFEAIQEQNGKNFHSLSDELKSTYADTARTQNTIYLRLNYEDPSPTVVNVRKSMWSHPVNSVAISIREAARLQSFRDDFIFTGSKDRQYQQIGNAVPPLLARAVAEKMLELLDIDMEPEEYLIDELGLKEL